MTDKIVRIDLAPASQRTGQTVEMSGDEIANMLSLKSDVEEHKEIYEGFHVYFSWGEACSEHCDALGNLYVIAGCPQQYQERAGPALLEVARRLLDKGQKVVFILNDDEIKLPKLNSEA